MMFIIFCSYLSTMLKFAIILIVSIVLFSSCSESKERPRAMVNVDCSESLLNIDRCFSQAENQLSFPIWFSDSIIRMMNIKSISRTYNVATDSNEVTKTMVREYEFGESGYMFMVAIRDFYEGMMISKHVFHYNTEPDEYGYSVISEKDLLDYPDNYVVHKKDTYTSKYLAYKDEQLGSYLFFLLNEDSWGSLSVDSILGPTPQDRVVYGEPGKVRKAFCVENTVKESEVNEYMYSKKGCLYASVSDDYPLLKKRSYKFGSAGYCVGYVDSLFTGDHFLSKILTEIEFKDNVLPVLVKHKHLSHDDKVVLIETEHFNYTFND